MADAKGVYLLIFFLNLSWADNGPHPFLPALKSQERVECWKPRIHQLLSTSD